MKRRTLVLTLSLLLSIATTARAGGNLNTPGGNVAGESATVKIYLDDSPTTATTFIISLFGFFLKL